MPSWTTLATQAAERRQKGLPSLSNFNTPNGRHPDHNNPPPVIIGTRKHNTRAPTWQTRFGIPTRPKRGNTSKKIMANNMFNIENPLAVVRSRASSTVSDPAAAFTGIHDNNDDDRGSAFKNMNAASKAAFKASVKEVFGPYFSNSNKSLKNRINAARTAATRRAAADSKKSRSNESRLNAFSKQLSKKGAANRRPTADEILAAYRRRK